MSAMRVAMAVVLAALYLGAPVGALADAMTERGAYLVNGIGSCGNCHSPHEPDGTPTGPALSGGPVIATPGFVAYPPNITPDDKTGIGRWTAVEIVNGLREGRRPDGKLIRPPMPIDFYRGMSDGDANAIAAYLLSLKPVASASPASTYRMPLPPGYGPPVTAVPDQDPTNQVAVGAYLASTGHCMLCHTPMLANGERDFDHRLGAGGAVMEGLMVSNITQDRETGIGVWTDAQIKVALTQGRTPDGRHLAALMPWRYLATMTDADLNALVAYLRTVPAPRNKVR